MATNGKMSHTGANNSSAFDRMKAAGYNFSFAGENIAWGQKDVPTVMQDWMSSPGHRAAILNSHFTEIGVATAAGKDGRLYWVVDFGTPPTSFQGVQVFKVESTSTEHTSSMMATPGGEKEQQK